MGFFYLMIINITTLANGYLMSWAVRLRAAWHDSNIAIVVYKFTMAIQRPFIYAGGTRELKVNHGYTRLTARL